MTPAEFLVLDRPDAKPALLVSERRNSIQLDVFLVGEEILTVVSFLDGDRFIPTAVSKQPHIPYNRNPMASGSAENELGIFVYEEEIFEPDAKQARFRIDHALIDVQITSSRAVHILWDTLWPLQTALPKIVELLLGNVWRPTVADGLAATDDTFFKAYIEQNQRKVVWKLHGEDHLEDWAAGFNLQDFPNDQQLKLIQCVIDRSSPQDAHLGSLGAGPIEDFLSNEFMDYVESDDRNARVWRAAIRQANWRLEAPDLATRISQFLADGPYVV